MVLAAFATAASAETIEISIASDCRLESVNVNIQRINQFGNQQRPDGFNVNGNITFRIVPK